MLDRLKSGRRAPHLANAAADAAVSALRSDDLTIFRSLLEDTCKSLSALEIDLLYRRIFLEETFEEIAVDGALTATNARKKVSRMLKRLHSN